VASSTPAFVEYSATSNVKTFGFSSHRYSDIATWNLLHSPGARCYRAYIVRISLASRVFLSGSASICATEESKREMFHRIPALSEHDVNE
jgi:hypothetical protein